MHDIPAHDGKRQIDWGRTSGDYANWRPDYPSEFYRRLTELNVGTPGQRILDLGTGVGFLAINFARQEARVTGVDVAAGQIEQARRTAEKLKLAIDFRVAHAEETGLDGGQFDVITASQCWLYFDRKRMIDEVHRLLRPGGLLVICHLCWLPREDATARASEQLILQHNPEWSGADWAGDIPQSLPWAAERFDTVGRFVFDTPLPFTRQKWRGRIRACRGVGASMSPEDVTRFDADHAELLNRSAPDEFTVLHRIDCFLLRPTS